MMRFALNNTAAAKANFIHSISGESRHEHQTHQSYIAGVGQLNGEQLKGAAATSNAALADLSGKAQWVQSFVADDKTFCIYLADTESSVHEHARLSGFPATKVTEVRGIIDPMTAV
jgi:hypothetical protein